MRDVLVFPLRSRSFAGMADKPIIGVYTPEGSHGLLGEPVPMDEHVRTAVAWRAIHVLPAEAEQQRQRERREMEKRAAAGRARKSEIIGPPDPRKGRVPMTR